MQKANLRLNYALELDSIPIIKEMLRRGAFATILPFALVHVEAFSGKLSVRAIAKPHLNRDLVIGSNPKRPISSAMKAVRALIIQQARLIPFAPSKEYSRYAV